MLSLLTLLFGFLLRFKLLFRESTHASEDVWIDCYSLGRQFFQQLMDKRLSSLLFGFEWIVFMSVVNWHSAARHYNACESFVVSNPC